MEDIYYSIHYFNKDNIYCLADCKVLNANSEFVIVSLIYKDNIEVVKIPVNNIESLFSPSSALLGFPEGYVRMSAQNDGNKINYVCSNCGNIVNSIEDECDKCHMPIYDIAFLPISYKRIK